MTQRSPLVQSLLRWQQRNFASPGTVALFGLIVFCALFLHYFGGYFFPVLASVVIAYVLHALVDFLTARRCPRLLAFSVIYSGFLFLFFEFFLRLVPVGIKQLNALVTALPTIVRAGQQQLEQWSSRYPSDFMATLVAHALSTMNASMSTWGQEMLSYAASSLANAAILLAYGVLIPLLVFFFLKDSEQIIRWFSQFMPRDSQLLRAVWSECQGKIGCYLQGRCWEIVIVSFFTAIVFAVLGLNYAIVLALVVGFSVLIPYVGAVVAAIPVLMVSLMSWGVSTQTGYVAIAYLAIIVLDGNLLVPWLFSGRLAMHPLAIILAVMIFGGIWGFWGVFFAIPLAAFADVVLRAWPREDMIDS